MAGQFNLKFNGKLGWLNRGRGGERGTNQFDVVIKGNPCDRNNNNNKLGKRQRQDRDRAGQGREGYCNNSFPTRNTALPPWSLARTDVEEYHLVFEWGPSNAALLQLYS